MTEQVVIHRNPDVFINTSVLMSKRIDANYYKPAFFDLIDEFRELTTKKKGYVLSRLQNLLKVPITGGATPLGANYVDEGIKFIRVQNVRENRLVFDNIKYIERRVHETDLRRSQLKPNDVLLTITGATYGIAAVVPVDIDEANMNQHSVRIRLNKSKLIPEYLSFFLNSKFGRIQTDRNITGSTRPALDYGSVNSIMVFHPVDIEEQKQIVKRVNKYLEIANKYYSEYKMSIKSFSVEITKKLGIILPDEKQNQTFVFRGKNVDRIDAIFNTPYLEKLKCAIKRKKFCKLKEIIKIMPKENSPIKEFYRLVDLDNISNEFGKVESIKEVDNLGSDKILMKEGDILISKLQPEKGKVVLINNQLDGCVASSELVPVRLKNDRTTNKYLWMILRTELVLNQWKHEVTGASRARIGKTELKDTLIPLPEKKEQEEIVKLGEKIISSATTSYDSYKKNIGLAKQEFINSLKK